MLNDHSCSFLGAEARGQKRVFIEGLPSQNACPCFSSTIATNPSQRYSPPWSLAIVCQSPTLALLSPRFQTSEGLFWLLAISSFGLFKGWRVTQPYMGKAQCVRVTACLHYFKCQAFIFSHFLKKTVEKELYDYSGLCGPSLEALNFFPLSTHLQMPQPFLFLYKRISNKLHFLIYVGPFTQEKRHGYFIRREVSRAPEPHRQSRKLPRATPPERQ